MTFSLDPKSRRWSNRRSSHVVALGVALIVGNLAYEPAEGASRCHSSFRAPNGRLVLHGDPTIRVIKALGSPDDRYRHQEIPFYHHGPCWKGADHARLHRRPVVTIEKWIYYLRDYGETLVRVTFRNGLVTRVCRLED